MREGKIILAYLPQADGGYKLRPALVLKKMPTYNDYLICGISTQLHQKIEGFDEIILPTVRHGIRQTSLIRLSFLVALPESQIQGTLGEIENSLHQNLLKRLADCLIS
jgi:mRNA interferase MazF